MEKNVGGLDEGIRITLGPLLLVASLASFRGAIRRRPTLAAVAFVAGAILTATGLTQRCPGNRALGRNTYRSSERTEEAVEVRERALQ